MTGGLEKFLYMEANMGNEKKKKTVGDHLLSLLLIIAVAVFLFAGYKLLRIYQQYKVGTDEYKKIEELAVTEREEETVQEEETIQPPIDVDFDALRAVNEDVVGWIYVEALDISYPIVQGENNDQYLHTTYEKTYNFAGSIFIDYENSDQFKDPNTIVYGHNMKNGSMFGTLKKIVSENAYETSHYFWILTPQHSYRYEIFSAYTAAVGSETYTLFKMHDEEYGQYLQHMKKNSAIDTGELQPGQMDNIVTLSTCTGDSSTRFVVQGVQMKNRNS